MMFQLLFFVVVPQMAGTIDFIDSEFLEDKRKSLGSRIALIATGGDLAAMLPIPGTGLAADVAIIKGETKFYREKLHIDDASMARLSEKYKIPVNELRRDAEVTSAKIMRDPLDYREFLGLSTVRHVLDFVPFLNTISAAITSGDIVSALCKILELCMEEARYMSARICRKISR